MSEPMPPDPEALIAALLPATGIPLDPAWRAAVAANLRVAATIAAKLQAFPLPDSVEPAPVYEPAVAKMFADRAAIEVTEDAMSLMGARGYVREHRMEKYLRDALGTRIYEGTPEVLALAITESLYDEEEW